jgi:hypothetical protein
VRVCDDIDNCSEESVEFNLILDENHEVDSDINLSWLEPTSGAAINNIDFPMNISLRVSNPSQTARIEVFLIGDGEYSSPVKISTLQPINNETIMGKWKKIPPPGTYKIYTEAYGWQGQVQRGEELTVTINN